VFASLVAFMLLETAGGWLSVGMQGNRLPMAKVAIMELKHGEWFYGESCKIQYREIRVGTEMLNTLQTIKTNHANNAGRKHW